MELVDKVFKSIKKRSDFIISDGDTWSKELSSAKNYVCTPDYKHWTFGKSAGIDGAYHANGGAAKKWLYSLGFVNVLNPEYSSLKKQAVNSFLDWTKKVKAYDIADKFHRDQKANNRFELLVHNSIIGNAGASTKKKSATNSQEGFDEGFKKQIVHEVSFRNKKLIALAKEEHGTKCWVCKFDFGVTYGTHGEGFIEMHHLIPISKGKRKTTTADLQPVCSNCHRMLHKGNEMLSIDELKEIIERNKMKR